MPRADQATIELLTDYFDAMEAKNFDRLGSYYTDDVSLTFANAPTITGRDAMLNQMTTLLAKVKSLAHPLINVWQEDGGVVIFEVTSIWRFYDNREVKINACFDLRRRGRQVHRPTHLRRQRPRRSLPRLIRRTGRTRVTRILITGSAHGLGRAAATTRLGDEHQVVVHARDTNRAAALTDLVDRGAALVVGDLASAPQTPPPRRPGLVRA
jgi:hypothetical protein